MRILPAFDADTIRQTILDDIPNLKIETLKLIDNGWNNVVAEINSEWIFRFPKDDEVAFDIEVRILDFLKDKITLRIPKIEYFGKTFTYMGYRKVQGGGLTKEILDSLSYAQKEKLIFDLANFLREIHSALTPDDARKMGVTDEDLVSYANLIKSVLPNRINDLAVLEYVEPTLKEYEEMIPEKTEDVFLYNDLHVDNLAFDPERKRLNGIFDFGDIFVGDVSRDFYALYRFDPYFMKAVAERYQSLTDRKLNLRRMVIYCRMNELCDLAEYIDKPESAIYQNVLIRIGKWKAEMDIFQT